MSRSSSPATAKDEVSMYNSALESLTFSSLNDSDIENINITIDLEKELFLSNKKPKSEQHLSSSPINNLIPNTSNTTKNLLSEFNQNSETSIQTNLNDTSLIDSFVELNLDQKYSLNSPNLDEVIVISSEDESFNGNTEDDLSIDDKSNLTNNENVKITIKKEKLDCNQDKELIGNEKTEIKIYDTLEEFEKNLPETVTILQTPFHSKVYLIGTAHFSVKSQDDVSFVIRNVRPDIVMVELCPSRIHILKLDEKTLLEEARDINISKIRNIIQTNGLIKGFIYILLLNMSAKITEELGMAPGGEFRRALEEVSRLSNCMLHLGDRPINITLQRALHGLSFWQTLKLVWRLITPNESISMEEVEQCKQRDLLEELMKEMAGEFPAFGDVFIKERDLYLCHSLQVAALPQAVPHTGGTYPVKVVGVVGIGHAAGIKDNWGKVDPNMIPNILSIPPASLSNRIFKFTFKYGILCAISYGAFKFIKPRIQNIL